MYENVTTMNTTPPVTATTLAVTNMSSTVQPLPALQPQAFILLLVGAFLSLLGCVVIVTTYGCSHTLQSKMILRQVFFQSIATFVHSLAFSLSLGEEGFSQELLPASNIFCQVQGVLLVSSALAGFAFNFYIAFDLLSFVGYTPQVKRHRLLFQLLVWPIAIFVAVLCQIGGSISFVGGFCWLSPDPAWVRWVAFYIPLFLILGFCLFSIVALPYKLQKMKLLENNRRLVITAAAYNIIFLICWGPASVYRFVEIAYDSDNDTNTNNVPTELEVILAFCLTTQGVWNCLVWISSRMYQREISKFCKKAVRWLTRRRFVAHVLQ